MARLTAAQRSKLPPSAFAGPGRSYPVPDPNHARAALSMVAQHGSPSVKKKVRGTVHKRFPKVGQPDQADQRSQLIAAFMKQGHGK